MRPRFALVEAIVNDGHFVGTRRIFEGPLSAVVERATTAAAPDVIYGIGVNCGQCANGYEIEGWLKNGRSI